VEKLIRDLLPNVQGEGQREKGASNAN
jgi:hypothetical protein